MSANITVMGMPREAGGIKEALSRFRKHHVEVGEALLNLSGVDTPEGKAVDPEDPRPTYVHQEWPKMMYHPEGKEIIVSSLAEVKEANGLGYRKEPYIKQRVFVEDPATEKRMLKAQLAQKDGEIAQLSDVLARAMSRLDALEKAENKK